MLVRTCSTLFIMAIALGICSSCNGGGPQAAPASGNEFVLSSPAAVDGGTLPVEYTCDGAGSTIALDWSNAPAGTKEFAMMMTTLPGDGTTRWNWVLYAIPGTATGLARNTTGIGIIGTGSHGTVMAYDPPCSQGPGAKLYTFTVYALSGSPSFTVSSEQVTGPVLADAIAAITLGKATLNLSYSRPSP